MNCGGLVGSVGRVIPIMKDAVFAVRKSATANAAMFVAAVCEVALRLVSTAIGTKANTVTRQSAATPRASVNSTSENAAIAGNFFTDGKSLRCRQNHLFGLRRGSPTLDLSKQRARFHEWAEARPLHIG